jgi:hypothetical protein
MPKFEMKYTQQQLHAAFDRVCNKNHWKKPINKLVTVKSKDELDVIKEAVIHFTGGVADIEQVGPNKYRVTASGYYNCVGA